MNATLARISWQKYAGMAIGVAFFGLGVWRSWTIAGLGLVLFAANAVTAWYWRWHEHCAAFLGQKNTRMIQQTYGKRTVAMVDLTTRSA